LTGWAGANILPALATHFPEQDAKPKSKSSKLEAVRKTLQNLSF